MPKYTVGQLKKDLSDAADEDELAIIFNNEDESEDGMTEVEDGDILDVVEAGGYVRGMRTILVNPRG